MHAAGTLTTTNLCAALPDIPKATVYRQVERLASGGVFEVESSRQVRGAMERRYRMAVGGDLVDKADARSMTLEDRRKGFTAAMAALIADFNVYLDRRSADPTADGVSYRQAPWLRPTERSQLIRDFGRILQGLMSNEPGADRKPYMLSTIVFPTSARRLKEGRGRGSKRRQG